MRRKKKCPLWAPQADIRTQFVGYKLLASL